MSEIIFPLFVIFFFYYLYWNYKFQTEREKNDLSGNLDKEREGYENSILFVIDNFKKLFKSKKGK